MMTKKGKGRKRHRRWQEKEKQKEPEVEGTKFISPLLAATVPFLESVKILPPLYHNMESESISNYSLYLWKEIVYFMLLI